MKFYHFGNRSAPVILLLPGTCCHWKLNFGSVISHLEKDFHIVMGEKYLFRYQNYFKAPVIHSFDMEHEELLVLHPNQWADKIKEVCL